MSTQPPGRSGFPFLNRNSYAVFATIPDGLVISQEMLDSFLNPSPIETLRFWNLQWDATSRAMMSDRNITQQQWDDIAAQMALVQEGLKGWINRRDDATTGKEGYGPISKEMADSGAKAFYAVVRIHQLMSGLDLRNPDTNGRLKNLCATLWEYGACMGLEMEAFSRSMSVQDLLPEINKSIANPWSVVETPTNFNGAKLLGAARIPVLVDPPVEPNDPTDKDPEWQETDDQDRDAEGGEC